MSELYSNDFFIHESGHVLLSYLVGAKFIGVGYIKGSPQPFEIRSDVVEVGAQLKISLGGPLAEARNSHGVDIGVLFEAFEYTICQVKDASKILFSEAEKRVFDHARIDFHLALSQAERLEGNMNLDAVAARLKAEWWEVWHLVGEWNPKTQFIADEMRRWHENTDSKTWLFNGLEAAQSAEKLMS